MNRLVAFDPSRDVWGLHNEVNRAFRNALNMAAGDDTTSAGAFAPVLDVEEDEDGFTLHLELPGVSADQVEVSLEENVLSISGERGFYADREREDFRRIERAFGRFHRSVRLPDRVDGSAVEATYRDGLLTIRVPKAEEAKPRLIHVQTG